MSTSKKVTDTLKKSLQKPSQIRKRSNSVGASPVLRSSAKKRDREAPPGEETQSDIEVIEPAPKMSRPGNSGSTSGSKNNSEMAALIGVVNQLKSSVDSLRQDMPTKEDLSRVEDGIKKQLDTNTKDIQKLFCLRQEDNEEFEMKVKQIIGNTQSTRNGEQYFLARRSLRMWPVTELGGNLNLGCKEFLLLKLDMPEDVVNGLSIELATKIQQPRRSKIENEVLVRFYDANTRDIVQSYALNLAKHIGRAGLRLEIPPQLAGTFRLFEQHAGQLRQQFPEGFKRSIKFEDISRDLVMDVKVPTASRWHRFTRAEIEEATKKHTRNTAGLSRNDVTERNSILHPGPASAGPGRSGDYIEVSGEESSNE